MVVGHGSGERRPAGTRLAARATAPDDGLVRAPDNQRAHRPAARKLPWQVCRPRRVASYRLVSGRPMSSRDVTIIGYLSVLAAGITLQVVALLRPGRVPSLGHVLSHVMP